MSIAFFSLEDECMFYSPIDLFIQKAVALWTGADDIDHAYTVGCYLHFSGGGFQDIVAEDLSMRKGSKIVRRSYVRSSCDQGIEKGCRRIKVSNT
jgi:hypothetical protein